MGFDVTVVDISKTAIDAIRKEAQKRDIKINTIIGDIEDYDTEEGYDIIMMTGVLHFLLGGQIKEFIKRVQGRTNRGGINIIDVFLEGSVCEKDSRGYYFRKGEIRELYSDWNPVEHESHEEEGNRYEFMICQK